MPLEPYFGRTVLVCVCGDSEGEIETEGWRSCVRMRKCACVRTRVRTYADELPATECTTGRMESGTGRSRAGGQPSAGDWHPSFEDAEPGIGLRNHMMRCMLTANLAVDMRFANGTQAPELMSSFRVLRCCRVVSWASRCICVWMRSFSITILLGASFLLEPRECRQQEGASQLEPGLACAFC